MDVVCDLHAVRAHHKDAIAVCDAFVEEVGKREIVLIPQREGARETVQNNRKKLGSITEKIVLCGRQTLLSVVVMLVAQIWKVYKQLAQTMTTLYFAQLLYLS